MPRVAFVDSIRIEFSPNEPPPPHPRRVRGTSSCLLHLQSRDSRWISPKTAGASRARVGCAAQNTFVEGVGSATKGPEAREGRMKPLPRMTSVEPVIFGVLKIAWNDGYEGVVDLRPVI